MKLFSFDSPLFALVWESDALTKCVLLFLLCMSMLCWTIFFAKFVNLYKEKKILKKAVRQIKKVKTIDALRRFAKRYEEHAVGMMIMHMYQQVDPNISGSEKTDLAVDSVASDLDSYVGVLSTTAAVAPLLGLFGTVWGLVHSFVRISALKSADIATVAPGIAEALITTLAGLVVAIPALMLFNALHSQLKNIENLMIEFGNQVSKILDQKKEGALYGTHIPISSQGHEASPPQ